MRGLCSNENCKASNADEYMKIPVYAVVVDVAVAVIVEVEVDNKKNLASL